MSDTLRINNLFTTAMAYSTLTGSTITASSITTPVIATTTGFTTIGQNTANPNRFVEIGSDAANSVYFDFHSSDSALPDYSTRIQSNGGATIGQGHMLIQASTINVLGTSGVGIGTSTPLTTLSIYNTIADSTKAPDVDNRAGQLTISNSKSGTTIYSMAIGMDQVYGIGYINAAGNSSTQPVCLNTRGGNVGIGMTNPTGKCHIYGAGQSTGTTDVYSLNVSSADSFNGNGGITVYSESINMKAGDLTWGGGVRVYGARIYIGGGYSINAAQNQGNIVMYTGNAARVQIENSGNDGVISHYVRYYRQYAGIDADASSYFQNSSAGSSAYFNIIIGNNTGNTNHFMNSSTRTNDGGANGYTIRNDTTGGVRFLCSGGGFASWNATNTGGSNNTNAVINYTNATTGNLGSWNAQGFTLFCNTSTPAGNQPALGFASNNYNANFISSLAPAVRWMDLYLYNATTVFTRDGSVVGYTVPSGGSNVSDEREKYDIKDLKTTRSLERILRCKPKYYKRKYYDYDKDGNPLTPAPQSSKDAICIGLLAQEVQDHNPHCISTWKNEMIKETDCDDGMRFGVNYGDYTIHLIGAVQELNCKITQLTATTETQATQIQDLSSQLTAVLARLSAAGIA
jgi:hypothetical protein